MCSVLFLPVQSDHVFQKLSYSLCGTCLSLSSLYSRTLPQTVRLFDVSLRSQAPEQQYTILSFSWVRRHGHRHGQSQTDLFTCTMVLHCGHTFLRRIDLIYGIALWAYLSALLVKDHHKCLSSTEKPQYRVLQHLLLRTCYGEVYGNIAREENG